MPRFEAGKTYLTRHGSEQFATGTPLDRCEVAPTLPFRA